MDEHPQSFEVTQDAKRRFHWMLYADGDVIAQSRKEGYATHEAEHPASDRGRAEYGRF